MAKVVNVNGVKLFKHEFNDKVVYAGQLSGGNTSKVLNKLYSMYNNVKINNCSSWMGMYNHDQYLEITCM